MTHEYYFWKVGFLLIGILDSEHNDVYAKEPADKLSRLVSCLFEIIEILSFLLGFPLGIGLKPALPTF